MFSHTISRRNLLGAFVLLCGFSLMAAALFFGPSAGAQSTTIPLGSYTGVASNDIQVGTETAPRGEYQLTFLEGGKFDLGPNGGIGAVGTYTISGNQVEFTLSLGVGACADKGVYQWSLQGNKLAFAPVAGQADTCRRRGVLPSITFFKTDQLDNLWKYIGPDGGRITALLSYENKIFAGASNGLGLFVSTDNGQTWKRTRGTANSYIFSLAAFNGVLYAGGEFGWVFASLDGGQTWAPNDSALSSRALDLTVHNGKLYAATSNQYIKRLTDNPYVWESAGIAGLTTFRINALASLGGNLFAGTADRGLFVSTDNGNTWASANNGITTSQISTLLVSGNTIYAASATNSPNNEVFFSDNNGQSWKPVGNGLPASFPGAFIPVYKLAVSGGKLFAASRGGILVNQGGNWTVAYAGSPYPGFDSLIANGNLLFAGATFDGVSRSTDGGATWSQVNNGLAARSIFGVLKSNGVLYAGSGDGTAGDGGFISTNEGQTWTRTGLPVTPVSKFLELDGKVFAATGAGLYVTSNQGQSWTRLSAGLPNGSLGIAAAGNTLFALSTASGLYKSTDSGQSWTTINNGLTTTQVASLVGLGTNLFVGTVDKGVFRSDNQGQSWSPTGTLPSGPIYSMAVSGDNLLAGVLGQAIYRSADNGTTWTMSAGGFLHTEVYNLYATGGNVFAAGGSSLGVMRSTDNGLNWSLMNKGLDPRYALGFHASGPTLYAAGFSGIYASNVLVNPQTTTSAASYSVSAITEKAIVAAFGPTLATGTTGAPGLPLPTSLAGTSIKVRDSNGVERLAPLFYVSPDQVNYQIPAGTAAGAATVMIVNNNGVGAMGTIDVKAAAPSVFAINATGAGPAAAVDAFTSAAGPFNATRANGEPNIIAVFGTGLGPDATDVGTNVNVNASVTARIDGNVVTLQYAGSQGGLVGLNQFNVILPAGITSGTHTLTFTRGGVTSNTTTLAIR